jgi:putative transposase
MTILHHRRSIRLTGFDYAQPGAYFVTLCTVGRNCIFGKILGGESCLNTFGNIVRDEWIRSAEIRSEISIDVFVIMPNHLHGIVIIDTTVGATGRSPHDDLSRSTRSRSIPGESLANSPDEHHLPMPQGLPNRSLGAFIAGFKSVVSKRINAIGATPGTQVWQRNFYDHIIRNEKDMERIREYIVTNPRRWEIDRENPYTHPQGR